jgi:hypothetical protein
VQQCPTEQPYREVTAVDYRFDAWQGEDLVEAMGEYAVSDRLRHAMEAADLQGVEFRDMVYRDSWKGDDLFYLPDHTCPVVTQRFVDLLGALDVRAVILQPARWARPAASNR